MQDLVKEFIFGLQNYPDIKKCYSYICKVAA